MENVIEELGAYWPLVLNAVKALVVLIVGWIIAGMVGRYAKRRVMSAKHLDQTIGNFVAGMLRWAILLVVLIAVLLAFAFLYSRSL